MDWGWIGDGLGMDWGWIGDGLGMDWGWIGDSRGGMVKNHVLPCSSQHCSFATQVSFTVAKIAPSTQRGWLRLFEAQLGEHGA